MTPTKKSREELSFEQLVQILTKISDSKSRTVRITRKKSANYTKNIEYVADFHAGGSKACEYLVKMKGETKPSVLDEQSLPMDVVEKFHEEYERQVINHFESHQIGRQKSRTAIAELFDSSPKFKFLSTYEERKLKQAQVLRSRATDLNKVKGPKLTLENEVDLEEFRMDYTHIGTMRFSPDFQPSASLIILQLGMKACPCKQPDHAHFPYNEKGRLRYNDGIKWECDSYCGCNDDCINRVVQNTPTYPLCIFRTSNGRGWGVKAKSNIPIGGYVSQYIGEVISNQEAEKRGREYDKSGYTYLMDIDKVDYHGTVDATHYGNESRFFNHSCEPNMVLCEVVIGYGSVLPRAAFFAARDIRVNEELTFDYQISYTKGSPNQMLCLCGSKKCQKYLS